MRLGQIMHALAFEDGIDRPFCNVSDEDMADELTRLRVAMLGEVWNNKNCIECGNVNDDNIGKFMCRTCEEWFVEGR